MSPASENDFENTLIAQTVKRIIDLSKVESELVYKIDLGYSNVYDRAHTVKMAEYLGSTLVQLEADVNTLLALLDEDE